MEEKLTTPFSVIYNRFLAKATDDLYMEMTKEETYGDLETILLSAIASFEFPRFPIFNYSLEAEIIGENGETVIISKGEFKSELTFEEIEIVSDLMIIEWVRRQINSVENTRIKYSGSDFKFTSQANHLDKLLKFKKDSEVTNKHKQRLYKRRKVAANGTIETNWSGLAGGVIDGTRN